VSAALRRVVRTFLIASSRPGTRRRARAGERHFPPPRPSRQARPSRIVRGGSREGAARRLWCTRR